jgi:tetratricopeptide (TPR) repeat protein
MKAAQRVLVDLHDPARARAGFLKAIEEDTTYPAPRFNLGVLAAAQERWAEAIRWFEEYLEFDATSEWATRAKAEIERAQMNQARDAEPHGVQRRRYDNTIEAGRRLLAADMASAALEQAERAAAIDSTRWEAFVLAGAAATRAKQLDKADSFIRRAQELAPPNLQQELRAAQRMLDSAGTVREHRVLAEAVSMFTPSVLERLNRVGYRPVRLLARGAFSEADSTYVDEPRGRYHVVRAGRAYHMNRQRGKTFNWGWKVRNRDFALRFNLRYERGNAKSGAGARIRLQSRAGGQYSYYVVVIDGSRESGTAFKVERYDSEAKWTTVVPWTTTSLVRANADNAIELVAIGKTLSLFINGSHASTTSDIENLTGERLDMHAHTGDGMLYSFDDFIAVALEPK